MSDLYKRKIFEADSQYNSSKFSDLQLFHPVVFLPDPSEERKHFRRLLADIAENRIVLISTHIVEDIAEISTELIVMKNGKIIAEGTANEALAYL